MRTQTSTPHHPGTLRHAAVSAVLVCAGWFAGVAGAAAQDVAGQGADAVQATLGGESVAAADSQSNPSVTASVDAAGRVTSDTSASAASSEGTDVSNNESVNVAENASAKKVFVTGASSVTRYDMAQLDDRVLGNQHGRAVGMLMVASVPNAFRGNSVTLWDEIAPPTQTPQPVDAARAAQSGNIVNYTRK